MMPEMKTLDVKLDIKEVTDEGMFEGYGSVFDVLDSDNEIVVPGAFTESLKEKGPGGIKMLWQHNHRDPIGVWTEMKEDKRGLFVKGKLALDASKGKDAHALLKIGALDGLSIGYQVVRSETDEELGIRKLLEINLWEVSPVTFPANPQATISAVKSFGDLALAPLHTPWGASTNKAVPLLDMEENIWLGEVDSEGNMRVIPKAIFSAAYMLSVGSGLHEADVKRARGHLSRYYEKMRIEFNDETILAPWDVKAQERFPLILAGIAGTIETERDFEGFLRDAGFPKEKATAITAVGFKAARQRDADGKSIVDLLKDASNLFQQH